MRFSGIVFLILGQAGVVLEDRKGLIMVLQANKQKQEDSTETRKGCLVQKGFLCGKCTNCESVADPDEPKNTTVFCLSSARYCGPRKECKNHSSSSPEEEE